jgi:c-di-AMP phosphodiesterase-like protein
MNKQKARKIFNYTLLAFVIFLYIFSIVVFLFGDLQAAIAVFAYSTLITVVVYFLFMWQRRVQKMAELTLKELEESEKAKEKSEKTKEESKN